MTTKPMPPPPVLGVRPFSWRRASGLAALNLAFWCALAALGALTSLNDDLREGLHGSYWLIFLSWGRSAFVMACLSFVLYAVFSRWPRTTASTRNIVLGYGVLLLVLLPTQMLFIGKLLLDEQGADFTWNAIERQILAFDQVASLLRLSSISAVYFAVATVKIWQQSQQARADSLAMRYELEHQRGLALRAQFDPHFVFNALNAISALVRAGDQEVVLGGIHRLSDLMRYALLAGERERATLSDELAFIEDYLALQRLRYGDRLQITITGAQGRVLDCEMPPLLLQPLVENALRHDLDCHDEPSDIALAFSMSGSQLHIAISNRLHREAVDNPGVGLGLRNTRARLQLAFGDAAPLVTRIDAGRFHVDITLPVHG